MEFDERDVIARIRAGEESAFNLIMDRYQEKLFRLALRLMRTREDAEDVLQEAFLKAFFGISKFRGESSLYTWLYAITLKIALKRRHREGRKSDLTTSVETMTVDPAGHDRPPDQDAANRELGRRIDEAVLRLPKKQRAVFVLRHQEEMAFREIGCYLGKSEGGVKALYFHAVRKMRAMLKEET